MHFHALFSLALALVLTVACGRSSDRREYALQGQVLSVAADRRDANIKHEAIPNFMPAMTMPYKARDAEQFAGLQAGDLITATLVVVGNDAYLENVRKVGEAPLELAPAAPAGASSGFELLEVGEQVPNAPFVDQNGRARDFASFAGSPVVVTFIYTKCPMPTFCPLMDQHFAAIQAKLRANPALADVRLVSVSFDPLTDTPPVLKQHAEALGADPKRWTFLTGDRDEIDRFAARFGVSIARDPDDPINIAHNLRTAIVDRSGALVKTYSGNEWTPDQVVADLEGVGRAG